MLNTHRASTLATSAAGVVAHLLVVSPHKVRWTRHVVRQSTTTADIAVTTATGLVVAISHAMTTAYVEASRTGIRTRTSVWNVRYLHFFDVVVIDVIIWYNLHTYIHRLPVFKSANAAVVLPLWALV
jgi:hypothetical protein